MSPVFSFLRQWPVVCLVTDRRRLSDLTNERELAERLVRLVGQAGRAGVDLVQIRERDMGGRALADLVGRCVEAVRGTPTQIVVNDRLDVALAAGAAGVHLRSDSIEGARVRKATPPGFLIGRSVHGLADAAHAATAGGLDYLILGTIFPSTSKPAGWVPIGAGELARATRVVSLPVLAIGGLTVARVPEVARAGAAGVAAINLFLAARAQGGERQESGLREVVDAVRRSFDTSRPVV